MTGSSAGDGHTTFVLDGSPVTVSADVSLLDALREELGVRTLKDGCSPQGQCGCCTVLVDGAARVACVTPVRRVAGRQVITVDGLLSEVRERWGRAFAAHGASQCGFCTPGIVLRLEALRTRRSAGSAVSPDPAATADAIRTALLAHLCRCTGWQSVVEAGVDVLTGGDAGPLGPAGPTSEPSAPVEPAEPAAEAAEVAPAGTGRSELLAAWRAEIEGRSSQAVGPHVALGAGGFADDRGPAGALVAVPGADGTPTVGPTLVAARRAAGKVQGRRTTMPLRHPLELPPGDWALSLRTTWVEPAYLEPDASWGLPGDLPASPLANGGAFGGKVTSPVPALAGALAAEHGQAVRVLWPREEVVRCGPKRPPIAAGTRADGSGVVRVARTPGSGDLAPWVRAFSEVAPRMTVEVVDVAGPPVSANLRAAGWAEAAVLLAGLQGAAAPGSPITVTSPDRGRAAVAIDAHGTVAVEVWAGEPLDAVVLRSYCLGAVHQALGWVRSEGLAVDESGEVHDRTIRSFGILSARDMPPVTVTVHPEDTRPVNVSDAVFAATAAAAWRAEGLAPTWPTRRGPAEPLRAVAQAANSPRP